MKDSKKSKIERLVREGQERISDYQAMIQANIDRPYNLVIQNGGIVPATEDSKNYIIKDHKIPKQIVHRSIFEEGNIGIYFKKNGELLLFDNLDPIISDVSNHPIGIPGCYELKIKSKHEEKDVPLLLDEVLLRYDLLNKLLPTRKYESREKTEDRLLATAIILTYRQNQCPRNMREYYERAGGMKAVGKAEEVMKEKFQ